jgi:hypothetical protein
MGCGIAFAFTPNLRRRMTEEKKGYSLGEPIRAEDL